MTKLVAICCLLTARVAFADEDTSVTSRATATEGAKGLAFSVPSGGGPTFGFAYFTSDSAAIHVDVGLSLSSQAAPMGGDRANTGGFSVEAGYRMYKPIAGKLTTFFQPSVYLAKQPGIDFGDALSAAVTAGFGVEYWVTPQWTFSGSTGVALQAKNNPMGSFKDISLTTGTSALAVSFYWM